jgi:WD40 repeat protein
LFLDAGCITNILENTSMHRTTFFTVGGTVQAGGGKYVHRAVDNELMQLCLGGTFGFVLTARQMGKSSLMVRTAERLAREGTRSVVIDLSQLGVQVTPDAWYLGILTRIEDALDLETDAFEWWEAHEHLGLTQRLTEFFKHVLETEVDEKVVIFIDEIDSTLSLDFTDDFFAAIRYVYNARSQSPVFDRLTFVLIGVASPNDLISDAQRTPFNIGTQVNVGYFTFDEALPLAEGFDLSPERSQDVLRWILDWTSGHPYLTQRLCATAASRGRAEMTRSELDRIVLETFFGQKSEEDSNLRFVQDMVVRRAEDRQAVLAVYERIAKGRKVSDNKASQPIAHLKLSGIVTRQNGSLGVSNRIYAEVFDANWVKSQWPEHWVRRVPPAVMGLVAASFIAVIALGLFYFQTQAANQALDKNRLQQELNGRLSDQIGVSDSLRHQQQAVNVQLSQQFALTDSIRLEQEAANEQLVVQIRVSNQLRAESEDLRLDAVGNNVQLSDQIALSDSLRNVAESLLEAARVERIETITIALASHAQRQLRLGDAELGALLARQAYIFSTKGHGQFIAPVHDALRESLDELGQGPPLSGLENASAVRSVAYSPAGNHIAWAEESGRISVAAVGQDAAPVVSLAGHESGARSVAFSPNENVNMIASGGEAGRILLWENPNDPNSGSVELGDHTAAVWTVAFSRDGRKLAAAGANSEISIWDIEARALDRIVKVDGDARVRAVQFIPGVNVIAAATEDGHVYLLDSSGEAVSWQTGQGRLQALAVSPDGLTLATGGATTDIHLWEIAQISAGEPKPSTTLFGHEGPVNTLAFSPNGERLASGSADHSIQIWDLSQPAVSPILLQGHESWIWSVAFRPDGGALVSVGADRQVSTWYVDADRMADRICSTVNRDLTRDEWARFVGLDVRYDENYDSCLAQAKNDGVRGDKNQRGAR